MSATCVVFSEEGLAITDISPELYDTLKKRVYQDWRVWVAQAANVVWAVWELAIVVSFWMGVYVETNASDIMTVLTVTGL